MSEINIGQIAEALNDKMDRDANNVDPSVSVIPKITKLCDQTISEGATVNFDYAPSDYTMLVAIWDNRAILFGSYMNWNGQITKVKLNGVWAGKDLPSGGFFHQLYLIDIQMTSSTVGNCYVCRWTDTATTSYNAQSENVKIYGVKF